jgi:hypothetical protein
MSRAVLAVVTNGSKSPECCAQPAAKDRAKATLRAVDPSGAGYGSNRSSGLSAEMPQLIGVLAPTPRGSMPIRS